jgi:CheY-like chemotaxis protein
MQSNNPASGTAKEHKKRILIIDDDPDYPVILKKHLSDLQDTLQIESALNGSEGLLKIGLIMPDLIILDIRMPGLDGFKTYDLIKSTPETKNIKVLFTTGHLSSSVSEKFLAMHIDTYLKKPLEKEETVKQVSHILNTDI